MRFQNSGMSSILEGLSVSRKEINEAKNLRGFKFYTDKDESFLDQYKGIIKEIERFSQAVRLMGGDEHPDAFNSVLEVDEKRLTYTIYGWKQCYEDEFEFVQHEDSKTMERDIKKLLSGRMKNFDSIWASDYWNAKCVFGYGRAKKVATGPYVKLEYLADNVFDR